MNMTNADIRIAAKKTGIKMWQIAERYGLHEGNFSRRLRHELPQEEKDKIFTIIDELAQVRDKEAG